MQPQGWESIRDEVSARIRARLWAPGDTIPGEETLAQEFGVARATVNRAMRELAATGVIERRRKAGTRVALLPARRALLEIAVIRLEVEGKGAAYSHQVLEDRMEAAPPPVVARLGLPAGTVLRRLRTLHLADGQPWAYEDRWLNPAALVGEAPDFTQVSANEWLVSHVPYATGDIAFSAEGAEPDVAVALGVEEGAALFVTDRATWTEAQPITSVRLYHAPGYRMRSAL
ncbi:GntR family transcriptional regulator [Tabrizicola sp. J26]|uniref:GntR family transcriptional regulator n=1 Tax=Alitabrizicola rongguiensis TaxID=2909234 RepID=UPI001F3D95AA|nr:GntR family transcriptional regulator [Tabrizicola rongguiensis]MCF1710960.1 GntR family transcriptional regulator [Tabrizicola rongguiensis]